jgi:hypothetical protein
MREGSVSGPSYNNPNLNRAQTSITQRRR